MERISFPLIEEIHGVGKKRAGYLHKLGLENVHDVINFFPRRYIDRRNALKISEIVTGAPCVLYGKIEAPGKRNTSRRGFTLFTAELTDGTGSVSLTWFNRKGIEYVIKEGTSVVVYGVPLFRFNRIELTSPDFAVVKTEEDLRSFCGIVPVYPSTSGISDRWYRSFSSEVLRSYIYFIKETIPDEILKKRNLLPVKEAILSMHRPESPEKWKEARNRLAYEELLNLQCAVQYRKKELAKKENFFIAGQGQGYKSFREALPFDLTSDQEKTIKEISEDMKKAVPMARLVQGDVGSGKTFVALAAAITAYDSGIQTAILAPTEVLAEQLYRQVKKWLSPCGAEAVFFRGSAKAAERRENLEKIKSGEAMIAVGTQALLESSVVFRSLGLVVIDEQHRFGVDQRAKLINREKTPHMLLMSATPIPRTLSMTLFADLEISILREKPVNQKKRETRIVPAEKMGTLLQFMIDEIQHGGRVYWICPRVEEEEESEKTSVEERYAFLEKHLGKLGVCCIHGRMSSDEKENAIASFASGEKKIIVGTTVLEVGVDVPEASVIVIEAPEMYGLSQLHQLRGRVGRGDRRGVCLLLTEKYEEIPERLMIIERTEDGFVIAEEDLKARGTGHLWGTEQHGESGFKTADLAHDMELLTNAREDAAIILSHTADNPECKIFIEKIKKIYTNNIRIG